jgi:hypothetical protein
MLYPYSLVTIVWASVAGTCGRNKLESRVAEYEPQYLNRGLRDESFFLLSVLFFFFIVEVPGGTGCAMH